MYRPICVRSGLKYTPLVQAHLESVIHSVGMLHRIRSAPIIWREQRRKEEKWRPFLDLDKGKHTHTHTIVEQAERTEAQEEVTELLIMLMARHSAVFCKGTIKLPGQLPEPQ